MGLKLKEAVIKLQGKNPEVKRMDHKKDAKLIYIYSEQQGLEKDVDINKDSLIELDKKRTISADPQYSKMFDIEIDGSNPRQTYKMIIASNKSAFGIDVNKKVREGTPTPQELTHLWRKMFMVKFNELQDVVPVNPMTQLFIGLALGIGALWVLKNLLGVNII